MDCQSGKRFKTFIVLFICCWPFYGDNATSHYMFSIEHFFINQPGLNPNA